MEVRSSKFTTKLLALMLTLVMLLGMIPATALATDDTGETETPAQYKYVITSNLDWADSESSNSTELPYLYKYDFTDDLVDNTKVQYLCIYNYAKLVGVTLDYVTVDGFKIPLSEFGTDLTTVDTSSCPNLNGREVQIRMSVGNPYIYFSKDTGEVAGDINIEFVFKTATYKTSVISADTAKGTATVTSFENTDNGTKWTITATPVYGYKFTKLTDEAGNEYPSADGKTVTVEVTQEGKSFTAQFERRDDVYEYVITSNLDWADSNSSKELPYLYKTKATDNLINETVAQNFYIRNYSKIKDKYRALYVEVEGIRINFDDFESSAKTLDTSGCTDLNGRTVKYKIYSSGPQILFEKSDNSALGDVSIHYEFRPVADFPTVSVDAAKGKAETKLISVGENETVWTVDLTEITTLYHFDYLEDELGNKYYPDEDGIITLHVPTGSGKTYTANFYEQALYADPEKDDDGVYLLDSVEDMLWFADKNAGQMVYDVNAALTADIDLTDAQWVMGEKYYGTFDGRGHTLTVSFGENVSLFNQVGTVISSKVYPGAIKNVVIKGNSVCAPLAKNVVNTGTVSGCINYATVSGGSGLIDQIGIYVTVEDCINYGEVHSVDAGGIVGVAGEGSIINGCGNYGDIYASRYAGGIVGSFFVQNNSIINCFNAGKISGNTAGGIVGFGGIEVTNCYNTGDISVTSATNTNYIGYGGGISGNLSAYETTSSGVSGGGSICAGCYSIGKVTGIDGSVLGAVVGSCGMGKDTKGYYISNGLSGVSKLVDVIGGGVFGDPYTIPTTDSTVAMTAEEMKAESFVETLGTEYFKADLAKKNDGYPVLVWEDNEAPAKVTVYVSVSNDGKYVIGNDSDSTILASVPMTVEYFDLADYGLEAFYRYDDNGDLIEKPTLLHVYIKLIEQYYLGGKTLAVGESKINLTDDYYALLITGSAGSMYMKNFWGHDENLLYYVNHEYPIMSGNTGATADWIVLEDYDAIDVAMYTDWSFYTDPNAGFPYFTDTDGKSVEAFESDINVEHTLTVRKGVADMNGESSSNVVGNVQVYYTTSLTDGDVTQWTPLAKADANGRFTFSFDKKGTYYIGVAGTTVSAPAVVTVSVYDSSELPYAATIGETEYETVTEALSAAKSGDTVVVSKAVEENMLVVTDGVTLDLNGKTVTANYVIAVKGANVIDSQYTGTLKVNPNNIILSVNNSMIPVYNAVDGYVFINAMAWDNATGLGVVTDDESDTLTFTFIPLLGGKAATEQNVVVPLLGDGASDNEMSVVVRLDWETDTGTAYQDFVYTDALVANAVNNRGSYALTLTLSNYSKLKNLNIKAMIISNTGAQKSGTNFEYNK